MSGEKLDHDNKKHWLYREENHYKLWLMQFFILILAIIPEFFMHHHAHFESKKLLIDSGFGFFAWYGFLSCALMVVGAKLLATLIKRKDDYYDE